MTMSPIRLAVIGAGLIGKKHLALVAAHPDCQLVGLCDIDPAQRHLADFYGIPFTQEVSALLEHTQPEGVIIATPNAHHVSAAFPCIARGIPLLIEKPIADTVENALQLVVTAEQQAVPILVGHHRRHNPLIQHTHTLLHEGTIGKLVAVSVHWLLKKPDDYFAVPWRQQRPGGGPALINLIHDVDTLRYLCGEISQVYAQSNAAVRGFAVEDTLAITLTFANGVLGTALVADATPAPWSYELTTGENPAYPQVSTENCYYFCGTNGSFAFPQMQRWHYPNPAQDGWLQPLAMQSHAVPTQDPLVVQLTHFCQVIRGLSEPLISGRDAMQSLAVIMAVHESAQSNQPVRLF